MQWQKKNKDNESKDIRLFSLDLISVTLCRGLFYLIIKNILKSEAIPSSSSLPWLIVLSSYQIILDIKSDIIQLPVIFFFFYYKNIT